MVSYPPIISSSIPAFSYDESFNFYFEYPYTIGTKNVPNYYLDVKISDAQTNKIAYRNREVTPVKDNDNNFYVPIPQFANMGIIYKIQLRLVGKDDTEIGQYSEWSTVCYAKATASKEDIEISILNQDEDGGAQFVESPVFMGRFINLDVSEPETYYNFTLFDNNYNLVETTGWLAHTDSIDSVVFSTGLNDFSRYYLRYEIQTKNKYIAKTEYDFTCSFSLLDNPNMSIIGINNFEEGCIDLHLTSENSISANIMLRRTDSKSNYEKWEDYKIFNVLDEKMDIHFKDLIIENGLKYQYGIQIIQNDKYRASLIKSEPVLAEYEYSYLVGEDRQLKIKFNSDLNSFKRNLQESKTDTIGSKYPFILRNGNINYFTFPIGGMISYHADEAEMFCQKNSLLISDAYDFNAHTNLTNDNIIFEREFRKQVEEFLTNGEYKYFKSPTEGVFLIALMGVSLTPDKKLGRMIYSFSATAYEINDVSLTQALNYGLISAGQYQEVHEMGVKEISGILNLLTTRGQNIYNLIGEQVYQKANAYERKLHHLNYLSIEINNIAVIPQSGYEIYIVDKNEQTIKIAISKELGYYELNQIFDIYGLSVNQANADLTIKYTAVCEYYATENTSLNLKNYKAISNFHQLYNSFEANTDIIKMIRESAVLNKIVNLTYLRVDSVPGAQIKVDNQIYTVNNSGSIEIKGQKITDVIMISSCVASISVIYNGFK